MTRASGRIELCWCAALAVAVLGAGATPAAAVDHAGREFVVAFLRGFTKARLPDVEIELGSDTGATVTISYPMGAPTFVRTVYVPPRSVVTVGLPPSAARAWVYDAVVRNAVHAVTTDPPPARFALTMVNRARTSSDSSLALPVDQLALEYLTMMPEHQVVKPTNQFVVAATMPGTTVTITPATDLLGGHASGVPFGVVLNAGDGYTGIADEFGGAGVTGTSIVADRPVAVTSGDVCVFVPPNLGACDQVFEMALPVSRWGRRIPVMGLPERPLGAIYRVLAAQDGTTVTLDGLFQGFLNAGQFLTTGFLPGPHLFAADGPIAVAQIEPSEIFATTPDLGDPAIGEMLAVEEYGRRHLFRTVGIGQMNQHWVTVVADGADAAGGGVALDGVPLAASAFVPIPTTTQAAAVVRVGAGTHHTASRNPHHVVPTGMGGFDSYLHAGPNVDPLDHFLCYRSSAQLVRGMTLADELGSGSHTVRTVKALCLPADKNGEGVTDDVTHLQSYLVYGPDTPRNAIELVNQFGRVTVDVGHTERLLVPTAKAHPPALPPPAPDPATHRVDHYRCLAARVSPGAPPLSRVTVSVTDQFGTARPVRLERVSRLCIPTDKNGEGIERPGEYLLCYDVRAGRQRRLTVATTDQFWSRTATVRKPNELCVPSRRTPLDECCVPRPTRCQVAGTDAGPCDTPPLQAACDAAGGSCRSVLCDERCGNGVLEPWCCEECDDGTRFEGDGCSSQCKIQPCCIPQPTRCSLAPDVPCDGDDDCERAGAAGA